MRVIPEGRVMVVLLTAILGHEMSHELLDPVVLCDRITVTPDESNAASSALLSSCCDIISASYMQSKF